MITIDGRCFCKCCEARTQNVYRLVGQCSNCGHGDMLMIFRAGDRKRGLDCPVCGVSNAVTAIRLATEDEIPEPVQP